VRITVVVVISFAVDILPLARRSDPISLPSLDGATTYVVDLSYFVGENAMSFRSGGLNNSPLRGES
jgi:hypothetical protein